MPKEAVELSDLLQELFERNQSIQAARSQWRATIERYPQETAFPDPMLSYGYFAQSVETRVGPQRHRIGVKQTFPYPGKRKLKGELVRKDVEMAQLQYEIAMRDAVTELKTSFYELQYLRAAIELTRQNQQLLEHSLRIATAQYAEENAALNDVLRAQSQVAQLGYDLITLKELELTEATRINTLLNRSPETALGPVSISPFETLTLPLDKLYAAALERRQELKLSRVKVERAGKSIELARKLNKPDISVDLLYIETGEAIGPTRDDGKDPIIVGFGINVPIWGAKNRARVQEAQHSRHAASHRLKHVENMTLAEVKKLYFRLENARRLTTLYREQLIPQAKKSMEISETWQREGKGSFTGFLETQSVWLNFNLAWQRAMTDYRQSLARLEQLAGGTLSEPGPSKATDPESPEPDLERDRLP